MLLPKMLYVHLSDPHLMSVDISVAAAAAAVYEAPHHTFKGDLHRKFRE